MTLLVRNGKQTGVDWRVTIAAAALLMSLTGGAGRMALYLIGERSAVLRHVADGDSLMGPVRTHLIDGTAHLDSEERRLLDAVPAQLADIARRLDRIERKLDRNGG